MFLNHHPGMDPVEQVVLIVLILLVTEMVIAWGLKQLCFPRRISVTESMIRLGGCAVSLYALFIGLLGWQWSLLPSDVAVKALVRFICSSIGVVFAEAAVWALLYNCATGCCPCITLDDGARSLEDIAAEEDEKVRVRKQLKQAQEVADRRAKMKKSIEKPKFREEDEV